VDRQADTRHTDCSTLPAEVTTFDNTTEFVEVT